MVVTKRGVASAVVAASALLFLAACGSSPGCRAATGAGIGAAGGAVVGALAGAPVAGALVGAAGGAAVGGLTNPSQVNAGPAPCE